MIWVFYSVTLFSIIVFIWILKDGSNAKWEEGTSRFSKICYFLENRIVSLSRGKYAVYLVGFVCLLCAVTQVFLLHSDFPYIGHDYTQIESRLIGQLIYAKNNGLAIEWATPLAGAGILSYANPQYIQYSPLYFLTLIMPFWYAYNLLTFLFSVIGFLSVYFLLKVDCKLSFAFCLCGAVLFSCTGYYIFHLRVGHWAFIYHPLSAFVAFLFFSNMLSCLKWHWLLRILIGSIVFTMMIFGGAIQSIFFYTCFTLLGMGALFFAATKDFLKKCFSIIAAVLLGFMLSLSKVIPMFMLAAVIDRGRPMLSDVPWYYIFSPLYYNFFVSPLSFLEQLLYLRAFVPIRYGNLLWEKDVSFPIIVVPLLILLGIKYRKTFKETFRILDKVVKWRIILFIVWLYLGADMYYDKGIIHSLFPYLNNTHLHSRMASVLILPLTLVFCVLLHRFPVFRHNSTYILCFLTAFSMFFYVYRHAFVLTSDIAYTTHDIRVGMQSWQNVKSGNGEYKIVDIRKKSECDLTQFAENNFMLYSSQYPYEPIYGYENYTFKAKQIGSPYDILESNFKDSSAQSQVKQYNFTHPHSLLFFNESYPQFSGFSLEEKQDLDRFLSFQEVDWKLPVIFDIANKISYYSCIFIVIVTIVLVFLSIRNYNRHIHI
ncbi:hypothetical protein CQA66_07915 [Helicobacter aurati]|uniref:YfhO family protein n=1 Tax=Helicobacter aurati TaxID=137778 RepID=A0A3D8J091_9HELI|nr:hypothetical protein [Helicobacter aurati]RDU70630.1 hypothetical protein CQA66_07915 [Helicobacter aurati]